LYKCMSADSLEEVIQKLTGPTQVVDLKEAIPQYIIVSGFTPTGDLARLIRGEVTKVFQASILMTDYATFDEEDDDSMTMDVPFPSVLIGSEAFRSVVCSSTLLTTSQVDIYSVVYLLSSQSLLKKPKLDSTPSVHISVLYSKSGGSENKFSEWTAILEAPRSRHEAP
jgi:hypothetical protein